MPGVRVALVALLGAIVACGDSEPLGVVPTCQDGDEQQERHGTDCVCCHEDFSIAGSIEQRSAGVQAVLVRDARGRRLSIGVNPYDNFFAHTPLVYPLEASVLRKDGVEQRMRGLAPHGSCNRCHQDGSDLGPLEVP